MIHRASGSFEVTVTPQAAGEGEAPNPSRLLLKKIFHGDLEGTSEGQMLSAMTPMKGSAGYVAIEEVTGVLQRRRGTFMLQHKGLMRRGVPELTITVIPDSGTAELIGLSGSMTIQIEAGKHSYDFEYSLGE
jgi:hypothetical protein